MSYSYLNHVKAEFLAEEEQVGDEADDLLKNFFRGRTGTKSRAFVGEGLRYVIADQNGSLEILEEDGEWQTGIYEPSTDNDYELIYEENGSINVEEIDASEAAEYFEGL